MTDHRPTKTALVLGAGGFIGNHMVKRLKGEGYWVRGVDLKHPEFSKTCADEFITGDLRDVDFVRRCLEYKGPFPNFYNDVPYRCIEPFHKIIILLTFFFRYMLKHMPITWHCLEDIEVILISSSLSAAS